MVEITDPYKVDPSLKEKSLKQLQHEITLRQMALDLMELEERKAAREAEVAEINAAHEAIVNGLKVLDKYDQVPEDIRSAYTTSGGTFAPHLKHKAIDATRLLAREALAQKPKRTRRKKSEM